MEIRYPPATDSPYGIRLVDTVHASEDDSMPDDEVAEQNGYWEMVASHGFSAPQPAQPTQGMPAQPAYGDLTAQVADGVGVRSMHQVTAVRLILRLQ
ncbi:hypothetical protein LTR49_008657 [Elasticomyces elasticus]|nr:hypothetical protein LTR49_008657 [Elasticomyces elasticus]KAK5758486.1 hypothetical protein LTS12_011348 [Elasticomyces elasticus]